MLLVTAQRLAAPGWWAGRDNTILTESTPSKAKGLKTRPRSVPPLVPTYQAKVRCIIPMLFRDHC